MGKPVIKSVPVRSSEITPEHLYYSRRDFLKNLAVLGAGAAIAAACGSIQTQPEATQPPDIHVNAKSDELGAPLTSYQDITNYNNYYEFTPTKEDVAVLAKNFKTSPWTVEITGLVNKPKTFGIEDLLKKYSQKEYVYRLRCVEAWSMVIPWLGFGLADLLKEVEPLLSALFVRFVSVEAPDQMPGQRDKTYPWPYTEGLSLDEAMNGLTILATGLYGKPLPPQDGAPIRLVVPWKYGYKSIKAITRIELVDSQPATLWTTVDPQEYGFFANVNPNVPHPRWPQKTERRIGEAARIPTLMFNGYGEQVAHLYEGMDLKENF